VVAWLDRSLLDRSSNVIRSTRPPAADPSAVAAPSVAPAAPSTDNAFHAAAMPAAAPSTTPLLAAAGLGSSAPQQAPPTTSATISAPADTRKVRNPLPAVAADQLQTTAGVQIRGHGVSPSAMQASSAFVQQTIGGREDIQRRMSRANVAIVIVPRGVKMTDLPEFQSLRGQRTFDGRPWEEVRGSGGITTPDGLFAVAVPEENLIDAGPDSYGEFNVGMHEFAHVVHSKGLSREERGQITSLYSARREANGPWTEAYGASNEREYFAQATNAFFRQNGTVGQNSPEWLQANDRAMYDFLVTIYGQPPGPAGAQRPAAAPTTPAASGSTAPRRGR
jgi:hypothetical protein